MLLKTHAVRVFWVLFRFLSTSIFNVSWVFVFHPSTWSSQEAYAVDTKGRGFTIPVRCPKRVGCFGILWASTNVFECSCLLPLHISIYVRFVTNLYNILSMFWYVSILFFMFVFVDANCKDLESRWCQNVKWMQGSFMSKDFMKKFSQGIYTPRACYGWDPFFEGVPSLKLAVPTWK